MNTTRTNSEWLNDLNSTGQGQQKAILDLREILLRASIYTLNRSLNDADVYGRDDLAEKAEDCAQESLIAVLNHLADFRGDSKFTTWVYKFAINTSLMTLRRERWKSFSLDDLQDGYLVDHRTRHDPDFSVIRDEVVDTLRKAIKSELTQKQQQVLSLIVFDEVPLDVVVERLGTNRNAVYKLLHDARKKLKRKLEENGFGVSEAMDLFSSNK